MNGHENETVRHEAGTGKDGSATGSLSTNRIGSRSVQRCRNLVVYALTVVALTGLLTACGGSGGVTPQPTPAGPSVTLSTPVPTPTRTYEIPEKERLLFELTWSNLSPSEKQATCEIIRGMEEDWLVDFFREQNPTATFDYRSQVILMKEKCI